MLFNLARFNPSTARRSFGRGHTYDGPGLAGFLPACAAPAALQAQDGDTIAVVGAGGNVPCQEPPMVKPEKLTELNGDCCRMLEAGERMTLGPATVSGFAIVRGAFRRP